MIAGLAAALLCDGMPLANVISTIKDALASAEIEPPDEGAA